MPKLPLPWMSELLSAGRFQRALKWIQILVSEQIFILHPSSGELLTVSVHCGT